MNTIAVQQQVISDMVDALFATVMPKKLTHEERLTEALRVVNHLDLLLLSLAKDDPHDANIEEAQRFAEDILTNLIGHKYEFEHPLETCTCGKCDSCIAARSDEHYSRKRDGELCEGRR